MPPYHAIVWGLCHDFIPSLPSVGGLGSPVVVYHAALCLAQPMRDVTGNASPAQPATASPLQGAQAVCRSDPQTLLCRLCTRRHASSTAAACATWSNALRPPAVHVRSTPPCTSVPMPTARIEAGSGLATCALTVIPAAVPGASSSAPRALAISSKRTAPSCMANGWPWS